MTVGPTPTLARLLVGLALALSTIAVPAAAADPAPAGTATAQPDRAGQPSQILISGQGSSAGLGQGLPQGITLAVFRGFVLDLNAVADRCTDAQATASACPSTSQVATGQVQGHATTFGSAQPFSGTLAAFLAPASAGALADIVVEADIGGRRGSGRGRLVAVTDRAFGYELRFDPLPSVAVPPGTTVTVDRLSLTIGATRTVSGPTATGAPPKARARRRRCRPRHGCRRRCARHRHCRRASRRSKRHRARRAATPGYTGRSASPGRARASADVVRHLITNPATCPGSWPLELRVRYSDHTDTRQAAIGCTG